jgi:hypothetical protein
MACLARSWHRPLTIDPAVPEHLPADAPAMSEARLIESVCASIRQAAVKDIDGILAVAGDHTTDAVQAIETARLTLARASLVQAEIELFLKATRRGR